MLRGELVRVTDKRNNCSAILCPLEEGEVVATRGREGRKRDKKRGIVSVLESVWGNSNG